MDPHAIFNIQSDKDFNKVALEVFGFQYRANETYQEFCDHLGITPKEVTQIEQIPFLPIEFFKSRKVTCHTDSTDIIFTSSGTTGSITSKHYVTDLGVYEQSFRQGFTHFYSEIKDYTVLALLPSYLERAGSSLIYMANDMIKQSGAKDSGFYLHNIDELAIRLKELDQSGKKILLIGVSFALLDLIEKHQFSLRNTIVMETGGMKGRRKELIRSELHQLLKNGFGLEHIHSEYGMTELLSQAYSKGDGVFGCPPWMRIIIRDPEDPLSLLPAGKSGGMNIIDLANLNSCSFIATQDLGKLKGDSFEVIGRFDHSDIRGCNLMVL